MAELSVVVITRNEAQNIGRCLDSVRDVASEIVVVDSFSDDDTIKICQQYGARIIQHEFEGFGKQKQFANSKAAYDWILSLDADEALSDDLCESVRIAMKNPAADYYSMNRLTNFCGKWIKHSGWYPDIKIRLFHRSVANWNNFPVHEVMVVNKNATGAHLKGDLLHYSINSLDHHLEQINNYSSIAANRLVDENKSTSFFLLIFKPVIRFWKSYLIKGGFLDGYFGFVIARNSAFSVYLRYAKARALKKNIS